MSPALIWRRLHSWWDGWTLKSGVTTSHLIYHPVMDMGSRFLTGWEDMQKAEATNGVKGRLEEGSCWLQQGGGGGNEGEEGEVYWKKVWPGLRSEMYDWGIRWATTFMGNVSAEDNTVVAYLLFMHGRIMSSCIFLVTLLGKVKTPQKVLVFFSWHLLKSTSIQ